MKNNQKIIMLATTDNMIWQFLLPHIEHLKQAGHTVECVCANTGFWFEELKNKHNLTVHEIAFSRSPITAKNIGGYKKLIKLQKQENYDLIYCQQPVGGLMGRLLAKKFKIPCIYTAHGFHFYKGCSVFNKLVFKNIEKSLSKHTDILITMNDEDYSAIKDWKCKHKFKINGIGVNTSNYKAPATLDKLAFRQELGLGADDFIITSVGELNNNKNTFRILEVIGLLPKNIKYIICGQGPLQSKYEDYIKAHHLQDRVHLLGFRKDVAAILAISNVYIMPSHREGLSRAMMEAMCLGLPVIASNIRGNTDLIGENAGGVLCAKNDNNAYKNAVLYLYNNPAIRKQMAKRNKEFVKKYDTSVVINQLENIYKVI